MDIETLYKIFIDHPKITTDSRNVPQGSLFFALRGPNFDGNEFAEAAIKKGAAYAIVDDSSLPTNSAFILVNDVLITLQQLATHHRRQLFMPVIGITGSNGKTTTKELINAALSSHYKVHATKGNFNNHIGVPLTLLSMPLDTEVAIIEMGANHQGEIDLLCSIAEPNYGMITNIGKAHLEGFGGIEGVKKGKSELYRFLAKSDGLAFINRDEPFLEDLSASVSKRVFYKQCENPHPENPDFEVKLVSSFPFLKIGYLSRSGDFLEAQTNLIGRYNLGNLMSAIAIAKYFKVPSVKIKKAIEEYIPSNNRSQLIELGSNTIILDAYNANPTSMEQAVLNFSQLSSEKKLAILGEMLELGDASDDEHLKLFEFIQTQNIDKVILVGKGFESVAKTQSILHFSNVEGLKEWFNNQKIENSHILIKGSRKNQLEYLLKKD